jgi:hypothetical protein
MVAYHECAKDGSKTSVKPLKVQHSFIYVKGARTTLKGKRYGGRKSVSAGVICLVAISQPRRPLEPAIKIIQYAKT